MRLIPVISISCIGFAMSGCSPSTKKAAERSAGAAAAESHTYLCGDLAVTAEFHGASVVVLTFSGRRLSLPHVPSGSGARYADDQGNEFWSKDGAMFTVAGELLRSCTRADAVGARSP